MELWLENRYGNLKYLGDSQIRKIVVKYIK